MSAKETDDDNDIFVLNPTEAHVRQQAVGMRVLSLLLLHGSELLDVRDLGAVSVCNKALVAMTGPRFKALWKTYAAAGEEAHLFGCFTDPELAATSPGGYKHAAGCLQSKECARCGVMAAEAHPLTLTRMCGACARTDEESWLVPKSKAKEAFLLTEAELRALKSASIPSLTFSGGAATTVQFLLNDVAQASLAKHGGAEGLQRAIDAKKGTALEKYNRSQLTVKPQKKKPRVTKLSSRPTDDLGSVKGGFTVLPVGVLHESDGWESLMLGNRRSGLCMTHSVGCPLCRVRGLEADIEMHKRLEHGLLPGEWDTVAPTQKPPPNCEEAFASLRVPRDLKSAVSEATKIRSFRSEEYEAEPGDFGHATFSSTEITFPDTACKVIVELGENWYICQDGQFKVYAQIASKKVPMELLSIGIGDDMHCYFGDPKYYYKLLQALGLEDVKPGHLLAALIFAGAPFPAPRMLDEIGERCVEDDVDVDEVGWRPTRGSPRLLKEAWKLLKDAVVPAPAKDE